MKRFSKGLFGFAGACFAIGLVMCVLGFALGGRVQNMTLWRSGLEFFHFDFRSLASLGSDEPRPSSGAGRAGVLSDDQAAGVHTLDIDVAAGSVRLREGDAFAVEASAGSAGVPEYDWGADNGTFYLRTDDADVLLWKKSAFTVTMPRGTVFRTVRLSTDIGSLELHGISCTEKAEISVGMGSVELEGSLAGGIRVDCGMGSAELRIPRPADYGYRIQCGMGSVELGEDSFGGLGADTAENTGAPTVFDLECGMGAIEVIFT